MIRQILLFLFLPLALAVVGWWLKPSADAPVLSSTNSPTMEKSGVPMEAPAPRPLVVPGAVAAKRVNTQFTKPEQIAALRATVIDVQDTVDLDARQVAFRESGLDTPEHLASALAIVREDYAETPTEKEVETRVLALHYLELSSHLDATGCAELLKVSIQKYTAAAQAGHGKPYLWDLHDVALTCTKLDPESVKELQRSTENPKVSAQLKLVLKTKGVI